MKFIRHLLSHLLLITLILGICAVYFFRYQVLPERYTQQVDQFAGKIHPELVAIASKKPGPPAEKKEEVAVQANQNIDVIYVDDIPLVDESSSAAAIKQDKVKNVKEKEVTTELQVAEEATKTELAEAKPEKKEVTESEDSQGENNNQLAEEKQETASSEDKVTADYLVVLRDARTAFGQGNMDLAVKKYHELIELENDEADFHGELGNVYYTMGKWQQAGASYYEAAVRLIETGQFAQVGYLQRVIQGLDAERAEKLASQLNTQGQ